MSKIFYLMFLVVLPAFAQSVDLSGRWKLNTVDDIRWSAPGIDDSTWPEVTLPQRSPDTERIYWLRRTTPPLSDDRDRHITIGLVSESYELYVNSVKIGDTGDFRKLDVGFFQPRSFAIPPKVAITGQPLTISLRIWNARTRWGLLANGLVDQGPYLITSPDEARSAVDASRDRILHGLTPALSLAASQFGIGVLFFFLWLRLRERRELLPFAMCLMAGAGSVALAGRVAFVGSSSFWVGIIIVALQGVAFAFLWIAAVVFLRLDDIVKWVFAIFAISHPFLRFLLLVWPCAVALRRKAKDSFAFVIPLALYAACIWKEVLPSGLLIGSLAIRSGGAAFAAIDLVQTLSLAAIAILILQRLFRARERTGSQRS